MKKSHHLAQRKRVADTLKRLRIRRGLSQADLATRARLHRTYVSLLERGRPNPSLYVLVQLAQALDVSVKELL